jgi:hypothetical protein
MRIQNARSLALGFVAAMLGCGLAAAQGAPAAGADKWYSVATSDSEEAFVNTNSIKLVGTTLEVRVKENFTAPRPAAKEGKTYLSSRTVYRIDCAARKIAMSETRAFPETNLQGDVVQKASRNDRNLIWMDAPRATVFGEILDYSCKHAPQPAAAG